MKRKFALVLIVASIICCMGLNGCSKKGVDLNQNSQENSSFEGTMEIKDHDGNVLINTEDLLSIDTISDKDRNGKYGIEIELTEAGADKFMKATEEHFGDTLDFFVNGVCVSSPSVDAIIVNGKVSITFDTLLEAYTIERAVKNGGELEGHTEKPIETESNKPEEPKKAEVPTVKTQTETEVTEDVPHREGMYGISDKDVNAIGSTSIFERNKVRNDVTGKWKVSAIAEDIQMVDYALSYYEKYIYDDQELHSIVNFTNNTTTCIQYMSGQIYVTVHEYVDGEEHDANIMFSGMVLADYIVYPDNGDIEKIQ